MYRFCPLASGSKGNCTYMQTPEAHLLIDAGISARSIEKHLEVLGVEAKELDGILVTHEHTDHIRALKIFSERYQTPIICNRETAKAICKTFETHRDFRFKLFTTGESFSFADLEITPFSVQHDAIEPVGFRLDLEDSSIGICTDLGIWTSYIANKLIGCALLLIEANHEPDFVFASARSQVYKERVTGRFGHLSNADCAELIAAIHTDKLMRAYLGHLSSECNSPEKAMDVIEARLKEKGINIELVIAHQESPCETYQYRESFSSAASTSAACGSTASSNPLE